MNIGGDFKRTGKPTKIGLVVDETIKSLGLAKKIQETRALLLWEDAVGEKIARHSEPEKVLSGKMSVGVDSSAWMNELFLIKKKIIKRLNGLLDRDIIKDINFRMKRIRNEK